MDTALTLLPILAVLIVGIVSPGPSFILVARTAVAVSRSSAIASALGMACGAALLSIAALLGLNTLFHRVPAVFLALKVLGGAYLLYLAYRTWRGADVPIAVGAGPLARHTHAQQFFAAVGTMVSNPKAAVQYGVIFAAMLPVAPTTTLSISLPASVFALEASWYIIVALALSAPAARDAYLGVRSIVDRAAGAVLAALGIRLLASSR